MVKDPYFIEPTNAHTGSKPASKESKGVLGLLIFGVVLAVGAIIFMFSNPAADPATESQKLVWRMSALEEYLVIGRKYSQSDDMKKFTSDTIILVSGDVPKIEEVIRSAGYNKVNKDIRLAEADEEKLEELRTAGVNGRFDTVYKPLLTEKIDSVMDQLNITDGALNSKDFHEAGGSMFENLTTIRKNLSNIEV